MEQKTSLRGRPHGCPGRIESGRGSSFLTEPLSTVVEHTIPLRSRRRGRTSEEPRCWLVESMCGSDVGAETPDRIGQPTGPCRSACLSPLFLLQAFLVADTDMGCATRGPEQRRADVCAPGLPIVPERCRSHIRDLFQEKTPGTELCGPLPGPVSHPAGHLRHTRVLGARADRSHVHVWPHLHAYSAQARRERDLLAKRSSHAPGKRAPAVGQDQERAPSLASPWSRLRRTIPATHHRVDTMMAYPIQALIVRPATRISAACIWMDQRPSLHAPGGHASLLNPAIRLPCVHPTRMPAHLLAQDVQRRAP